MRPTKIRRYTTEQREAAIKLSERVGPNKAAVKLGIPMGTIGYWAYAAREQMRLAAKADVDAVDKSTSLPASEPAVRRKPGRPRMTPQAEASSKSVAVPAEQALEQPTTPVKSSRKLIARTHLPSARARALELADKVGVTEASRQLGITRFSIYDWRRKAALASAGTGQVSPVAGDDVDPGQVRDARILEEWKAHPGLGPSQIRNQLRRAGMKVSVHTVRVVLDANGYVTPRTKRTEVHDHRYEAVRPNQLWSAT